MNALPAQIAAHGAAQKEHFHIVVAGEFNAGKSSVINLLLRSHVLPAQLNVSDLPPAHICAATEERYEIPAPGGRVLREKEAFLQGRLAAAGDIRIHAPLPGFEGAMITEVSVGQDGTLAPERREIIANADLLIWCSMGQRAWCLSEISIIETLPPALLKTAILAVSRCDYLRNTDALTKVQTRLEREAGGYFSQILMLDCSRKALDAAGDDSHWQKSGGRQLFDAVQAQFSQSPFYGRPPLALAPLPTPEPAAAPTLSVAGAVQAWEDMLAQLSERLAQDAPAGEERAFARHAQESIAEFAALVLPAIGDSEHSALVQASFAQAQAYLAQATTPAPTALVAALLAQLGREIVSPPGGGMAVNPASPAAADMH